MPSIRALMTAAALLTDRSITSWSSFEEMATADSPTPARSAQYREPSQLSKSDGFTRIASRPSRNLPESAPPINKPDSGISANDSNRSRASRDTSPYKAATAHFSAKVIWLAHKK
jgi:hypothetical protein